MSDVYFFPCSYKITADNRFQRGHRGRYSVFTGVSLCIGPEGGEESISGTVAFSFPLLAVFGGLDEPDILRLKGTRMQKEQEITGGDVFIDAVIHDVSRHLNAKFM